MVLDEMLEGWLAIMEQRRRWEKADWKLSGGFIKPCKDMVLIDSLAQIQRGVRVPRWEVFTVRRKHVNKGRFVCAGPAKEETSLPVSP